MAAPVAHRAYRLKFLSAQNAGEVDLGWVKMFGAHGKFHLTDASLTSTAGGTAIASGTNGGALANVFNYATSWNGDNWWNTGTVSAGAVWVGWDFGVGNAQAVAAISLSGYNGWSPTSWQIQYCDDTGALTNWVDLGPVQGPATTLFGAPAGQIINSGSGPYQSVAQADTTTAGHRYWRIYWPGGQASGSNDLGFYEITLQTAASTDRIRDWGLVRSSPSAGGGFETFRAFDRNTGTSGFTVADGTANARWWAFDLGQNEWPTQLVFDRYSSYFRPQLLWQYSDDAITWTTNDTLAMANASDHTITTYTLTGGATGVDGNASGGLVTLSTSVYYTGQAVGSTVLLMEGWDGYSTWADVANEYIVVGGSGALVATGGRFGGQCVELSNAAGVLRKQLGMSFTQAWMGLTHRRDRIGGTDDRVAQWCSGATGTIELTLTLNNATGQLKVWRGDLVTLLATATVLVPNPLVNFHFYEWFVNFDGAAGSTQVWADGVPVIQATGLNTKQTAATALTAIQIGSNVSVPWMMYDDMYVTLGPRLGDMRIVNRVPTSDASPNAGTPSTGTTHWGVVDETPVNYTDYVTLTNVNLTSEMFGLSAFPAAAVKVHGVRVSATGRKNAAVNSYNISVVAKSGTAESVSDPVGLSYGSTWVGISKLFPADPATGAGWTVSAAAAMIAGVRVMV